MGNPIIDESYQKEKKKAKEFYAAIGRVWCPALDEHVVFNNTGFRHLIRK